MATTEDRFAEQKERTVATLQYEFPLASGTSELPENTLAELDGSDELTQLDHSGGDDDSGVDLFAVLRAEDTYPYLDGLHYDRGGTEGTATVYGQVLLELEDNTGDVAANYDLFETVYAVDNETVDPDQADGSGGSLAPVGQVYDTFPDKGTVLVHVDGPIT